MLASFIYSLNKYLWSANYHTTGAKQTKTLLSRSIILAAGDPQ